jgi:L-tyrosine isonitrile synthase
MSSTALSLAANAATVSFARNQEPQAVILNYGHQTPRDEKSAGGHKGKSKRAPKPEAPANAEKVLRSFNTWAFKREQPSDQHMMLRFISRAIDRQEPVKFVLYWGKGPRNEAGEPEVQCLDYLANLASHVKSVYAPGAAIKLILTDTHAGLNGHSPENIRCYFDDIKNLAGQRGFETCWLGHLVEAAGSFAIAAPLDDMIPAETVTSLIASAGKWYRGGGTVEEGALKYLRMNLIELRVVERAFPDAIFVTFNGSGLRSIFPQQLPIFYMYSLRRGFGVKPWFLPAESGKSESHADLEHTIPPDAA